MGPAMRVHEEAKLRGDTVLSISSVRVADRVVAITLDGEIDYATAPRLRGSIMEALTTEPAPTAIVVDMAGVTFVDSIGLGTVVVGYRICRQVGVKLAVRNPSEFVARLLEVSGVTATLRR